MDRHRNVITELLAQGLTYRKVADRIGEAHQAVIGWCTRNGLKPADAVTHDAEEGGIPFSEAGAGQCRRPLWSSRETTGNVCGAPAETKHPYCPSCEERMYWRAPEALAIRRALSGGKF